MSGGMGEVPKVEKYPFNEKKEMQGLNKRLTDYVDKVSALYPDNPIYARMEVQFWVSKYC